MNVEWKGEKLIFDDELIKGEDMTIEEFPYNMAGRKVLNGVFSLVTKEAFALKDQSPHAPPSGPIVCERFGKGRTLPFRYSGRCKTS